MRCLVLTATYSLVATFACVSQTPNWMQAGPNNSPAARVLHAMAYDSGRQRTVLFGGLGPGRLYQDTWEFDGVNWTQIRPKTAPGFSIGHAMTYDSVRRRLVLVGYKNSAFVTFEWDGLDWVLNKTRNAPPARMYMQLVYDSVRQRVVLYGGNLSNTWFGDTWEYDGTNWTNMKPSTSPGYRVRHAMAYDSARRRTVLFGGNGQNWDVWEWDGVKWTKFKILKGPWARQQHAMAYDVARQRVLVYGGVWGSIATDTWEWDGKVWTEIKPKLTPAARVNHGMVYDSVRQRMVMFGGVGASYFTGTWEFGSTPTLTANTSTISFATGGSQKFTLNAGLALRNKPYCIFGSITGSMPGVVLTGIHIPLNPDHYTDLAIRIGNSPEFTGFKGVLSATGTATASLNVPKGLPPIPTTLHHAFVVYDATTGEIFTASNPVSVQLR